MALAFIASDRPIRKVPIPPTSKSILSISARPSTAGPSSNKRRVRPSACIARMNAWPPAIRASTGSDAPGTALSISAATSADSASTTARNNACFPAKAADRPRKTIATPASWFPRNLWIRTGAVQPRRVCGVSYPTVLGCYGVRNSFAYIQPVC